MRLKPIFDTNIFGHLQSGQIPQSDWEHLLRVRPQHGWPLSAVTALELLAGPYHPDSFPQFKRRIELAYQLSRGRVLGEPRPLICKTILHRPFPPQLGEINPNILALHLDVVRRANSLGEILEGRVVYKPSLSPSRALAGFRPSVITELLAGPKNEWIEITENLADKIYPRWREQIGKRLPLEMRKALEPWSVWDAERTGLTRTFLEWVGAEATNKLTGEIMKRLDAALEFTLFVVRQFLLTTYSLEQHDSDVYDAFQLHYLAMDPFVIVSNDPDFANRTRRSSQAQRIMNLSQFIRSVPPPE